MLYTVMSGALLSTWPLCEWTEPRREIRGVQGPTESTARTSYLRTMQENHLPPQKIRDWQDPGKMYINLNYLMSFNKRINLLWKARGYGGTLGMKGIAVRTFLRTGKKFVWLRFNEVDVKKITFDDGKGFFTDLKEIGIELDGKIDSETTGAGRRQVITGGKICINGQTAGTVQPLFTWEQLKGNDWSEYKWIFFDEFIPPAHKRLGYDTTKALANMIESIARTRDGPRIIMTANTEGRPDACPIVRALGFTGIKDFGVYVNRNKEKDLDKIALLWYSDTSRLFKEKHAASLSGQIARLMGQQAVILDNKFEAGDNRYLDPSKKRPFMMCPSCIIHTEEDSFRVCRGATKDPHVYILMDPNKTAYMDERITFDKKIVSQYVRFGPKELKEWLFKGAQSKTFVYENEYVEELLYSVF